MQECLKIPRKQKKQSILQWTITWVYSSQTRVTKHWSNFPLPGHKRPASHCSIPCSCEWVQYQRTTKLSGKENICLRVLIYDKLLQRPEFGVYTLTVLSLWHINTNTNAAAACWCCCSQAFPHSESIIQTYGLTLKCSRATLIWYSFGATAASLLFRLVPPRKGPS